MDVKAIILPERVRSHLNLPSNDDLCLEDLVEANMVGQLQGRTVMNTKQNGEKNVTDQQEGKLIWVTGTPPPQDGTFFIAIIEGNVWPSLAVWEPMRKVVVYSHLHNEQIRAKLWWQFETEHATLDEVLAWIPIPEAPDAVPILKWYEW